MAWNFRKTQRPMSRSASARMARDRGWRREGRESQPSAASWAAYREGCGYVPSTKDACAPLVVGCDRSGSTRRACGRRREGSPPPVQSLRLGELGYYRDFVAHRFRAGDVRQRTSRQRRKPSRLNIERSRSRANRSQLAISRLCSLA